MINKCMWILSFLPETVIHLLLSVGIAGIIAGFFLTFIPFIKTYSTIIQIVSVLVLALGIYLEGGLSYKKDIDLKVKELEVKLANAEKRAAETNVQIVTKVLTQKQIIREKGDKIIQYVDREIVKYDNSCPIPEVVIKAHNAAATNDLGLLTEVDTTDHNKATKKKPMLLPAK